MIGTSTAEYIWVVWWATILNSIGPLSALYCVLATYFPQLLVQFRGLPLYWAATETVFYILSHIYRRHHIQRPAIHPLLTSKGERDTLFDRCVDTTRDAEEYISKWFLDAPLSAVRRDNIKEFFRWAFLNTDVVDPNYEDEVEPYVKKLEGKTGLQFEQGKSDIKSLRLTIDRVDALHRSLTWYMCIFVVDTITHVYLSFHKFHFYRGSLSHSVKILPPRPQASLTSQRSPSSNISYWYRQHTSATEAPILFLHGIGVGLYPYMEFLKELNQGRNAEDGDIGILAVEILPISSRLTSPILPRLEMIRQLRDILNYHHFHQFVLMSHSYGSVIATHLLKTPDLASRLASIILVDPISILLNQPDVAYNFTIRKPKHANEWLLWYFGSKDIGVAHTLARTFFWSENVLWKEDVHGHRCVVFLAERDAIINAEKVRAYLQDGKDTSWEEKDVKGGRQSSEIDGELRVVWCDGLDHGQVFDTVDWRQRLRREVLGEVRRVKGEGKTSS